MVCCINCKKCETVYQDTNADMYNDRSIYGCLIDGFLFDAEIAKDGDCDFYEPLDSNDTKE